MPATLPDSKNFLSPLCRNDLIMRQYTVLRITQQLLLADPLQTQRRAERAAREPAAGTRCWAPSADQCLILPSLGPMERSATSVS